MATHNPQTSISNAFQILATMDPNTSHPRLVTKGGGLDPIPTTYKTTKILFFFGGARYLVLYNWVEDVLEVYKSTDGLNWNGVDQAHAPETTQDDIFTYLDETDPDNVRLYIAYQYSTDEVRIAIFNFSTGLYEAEIEGGPDAIIQGLYPLCPGNFVDYYPVVRSDGSVVLVWRSLDSGTITKIRFSVYTPGVGWAASVYMDPLGTGVDPSSGIWFVWKDPSDRVHVFIGTSYNIHFVRTINADNSLSDTNDLGFFPESFSPVVGSSTIAVGMCLRNLYAYPSSRRTHGILIAEAADQPLPKLSVLSWDYFVQDISYVYGNPIVVPRSSGGGYWVLIQDGIAELSTYVTRFYLLPVSSEGNVGTPQFAFAFNGRMGHGDGILFTDESGAEPIEKIAFTVIEDDIASVMVYWEGETSDFTFDAPGGAQGARFAAY